MNEAQFKALLESDEKYASIISEVEQWADDFRNEEGDDKSKRAAGYIMRTAPMIRAIEEFYTGEFEDSEDAITEGQEINGDVFETYQEMLLSVTYRIAQVNRIAHETLNDFVDWDAQPSPLEEVISNFVENGQAQWFVRGFKPEYLETLNVTYFS